MLSFDRYSRDDIIGELTCALSSVPGLEDADNQEISLCRKICPRSLKVKYLENSIKLDTRNIYIIDDSNNFIIKPANIFTAFLAICFPLFKIRLKLV